MADVHLLGEWLLEYSCSHRMTSVLHVLSKEAPGNCTAPNFVTQILTEAVGDVPARYMLAVIETVMEDEDTRQYELALSFVDHLFDAMHGSVQFKIYAKVMTGLKILTLFQYLREKNTKKVFALLNKYFPKGGYSNPYAPQSTLKKISDGNKNFRDFFVPLIADASRRRTYLSENFDNDFGHDFQTSLKNHVKTLTSQMKAVLPKPVLEKLMEHPEAQQQLSDLTSGVMTLLLTAIDGKETLSETETRDLLLSIIKTSKPESLETVTSTSEESCLDLNALLASQIPAVPLVSTDEATQRIDENKHQNEEIKIDKITGQGEEGEADMCIPEKQGARKVLSGSQKEDSPSRDVPSKETPSDDMQSDDVSRVKMAKETSSNEVVPASMPLEESSKVTSSGESLFGDSASKKPDSRAALSEGLPPENTLPDSSSSTESERLTIHLPPKRTSVQMSEESPCESTPSKRSQSESLPSTESSSNRATSESLPSTESSGKVTDSEKLQCESSPSQEAALSEKPEKTPTGKTPSNNTPRKRPPPQDESAEDADSEGSQQVYERCSSLRSGSSPLKRLRTDLDNRQETLKSTPTKRRPRSQSQSSDDILSPSPQTLRPKMTSSFRFRSTKQSGSESSVNVPGSPSRDRGRIEKKSSHLESPSKAGGRHSLGGAQRSPRRSGTNPGSTVLDKVQSPCKEKISEKPNSNIGIPNTVSGLPASPLRKETTNEDDGSLGRLLLSDSCERNNTEKLTDSSDAQGTTTNVVHLSASAPEVNDQSIENESDHNNDKLDNAEDSPEGTQASLFGSKSKSDEEHSPEVVVNSDNTKDNQSKVQVRVRQGESSEATVTPNQLPDSPSHKQSSPSRILEKLKKALASPSQELSSSLDGKGSPDRVEGSPNNPQGSLSDVQSSPTLDGPKDTQGPLTHPQHSPRYTHGVPEYDRPTPNKSTDARGSPRKVHGSPRKGQDIRKGQDPNEELSKPNSAQGSPNSAQDSPLNPQGSLGSAQSRLGSISCSLGKVSVGPYRGRGSRIRGGACLRGSRPNITRPSLSPVVRSSSARGSPSSARGSPSSVRGSPSSARGSPASLRAKRGSPNSAAVSPDIAKDCPFLAVSSPLDKSEEASEAGSNDLSGEPRLSAGSRLLPPSLSSPSSRKQSLENQSQDSCSFRTCVQDDSDADWQSCADITEQLEADKDLDASMFKTCGSTNQESDAFSSVIVPSSNSFDKYNAICGTPSQLVRLSIPDIRPSQPAECRKKCIVKLYKSEDPNMDKIYM